MRAPCLWAGWCSPWPQVDLPESPETKRRLKNLMDVTGLSGALDLRTAAVADIETLARVHPASFLSDFKAASDTGGGELGLRTPFGQGGFEIAALSAGLSVAALEAVLRGEVNNAYALSRPAGPSLFAGFPERLLSARQPRHRDPQCAGEGPRQALRRVGLGRASRQRDRGDFFG